MFDRTAKRLIEFSEASLILGSLTLLWGLVSFIVQNSANVFIVSEYRILFTGVLLIAGGLTRYITDIKGVPFLGTTVIAYLITCWASALYLLMVGVGVL